MNLMLKSSIGEDNGRRVIMTGVEKFEIAIMEFGVDAALEYFATPKELHYLWTELKEKELDTLDINRHKGVCVCSYLLVK